MMRVRRIAVWFVIGLHVLMLVATLVVDASG